MAMRLNQKGVIAERLFQHLIATRKYIEPRAAIDDAFDGAELFLHMATQRGGMEEASELVGEFTLYPKGDCLPCRRVEKNGDLKMKYVTVMGELYRFAEFQYREWLQLGARNADDARARMKEFAKYIGRREAEVVDWERADFANHLKDLNNAR